MSYNDDSIDVIREDVEKIRKRPTMYIDGHGWESVMHLFKEVIQNCIDEAENDESPCDEINVIVDETTKKITVADNGRGIPLGKIVDICTVIQSSGKFGSSGKNYKFSAGTNGKK